MRAVPCIAAITILGLLASSPSARAQGALVAGSVSAALANDHTSPSYSGAVAWRFNRALGFGVEVTHTRDLESDGPIVCCGSNSKARLTTFTTNVRLEIPTVSDRIIPFVVGGGGIAATTSSYSVYYALGTDVVAQLAPLGLSVPPIQPGPIRLENTTTQMALTLGGGASFLMTRHMAIDVDLRVLHTMGDASGNIGRFGAGVSYRF